MPGRDGILGIDIVNQGSKDTGPLLADVATPAGVTPGGVNGDGWSRQGGGAQPAAFVHPASMRAVPAVAPLQTFRTVPISDSATPAADPAPAATLSGPSIPAGSSSTAYLTVSVAADAPLGGQTVITVRNADGTFHRSFRTTVGIQSSGLAADYAGAGGTDAVGVGNTLLTCPKFALTCGLAQRRIGRVDNNDWAYLQPTMPSANAAAASAADLHLPAGTTVAWARLSWSGVQCGCTSDHTGLLRYGDSGQFSAVAPDRVETAELEGRTTYQATADVTALVRSGGRWWFGLPHRPAAISGDYAGWSLLVVVKGPGLPQRRVVVFDDYTAVPQGGSVQYDLTGIDGGPARVTDVVWDGDLGLSGDQVSIDGSPLGPANQYDSSAAGSVGQCATPDWDTFGTDVHTHELTLAGGDAHTLVARTGEDAYLLGALVLSVAGN